MHTRSTILFLLSCMCLIAADTPKWKTHANKLIEAPFQVLFETSYSKQPMVLLGFEEEQLIFQVDGEGGRGSMPISQMGDVWISAKTPKNYSKALGSVGTETFSLRELNTLRKTAYPMVRFIYLPDERSSFRNSVLKLLEGLIQLQYLEEAAYLVGKLDLNKLNASYEEISIELSDTLRAKKNTDLALSVMSQIPLERISHSNLQSALNMANALRDDENFSAAIKLYSRIHKNPSSKNLEPVFWNYYCELQLGFHDDNKQFPEAIKQLQPGEEAYALQQLVLGSYHIRTQQAQPAMRAISEGIAYATPMDAWMPELMYRSALLYESLDLSGIATSVHNETTLFFPNSRWAQLSKARLNP